MEDWNFYTLSSRRMLDDLGSGLCSRKLRKKTMLVIPSADMTFVILQKEN